MPRLLCGNEPVEMLLGLTGSSALSHSEFELVEGEMMEPMRTDMVIGTPRHLAWETLADLEGVSQWNPAIDAAECVSDQRRGIGARRRCYMHPSGWIVESVTEWEPELVIAFAIENAPPIRTGLARFVLSDDEAGTRLQATFTYEVRFGPLGPVIDRLIVQRHLSSSWNDGVDGLRRYLEEQAIAYQLDAG